MSLERDQSPGPPGDASVPRAGAPASLTYEPFFGLHEKPFSLSADPRFLFRSPAHTPAFDDLQAGIRRREGLIVLTGEIGTGKTTVCRSVVQGLDRRTFAAFVADPFVSREDLLKTLLVDFGVISMGDLARGRFTGASRSDLSYPLYEFLDSLVQVQAFAVVVIDEAQNLSLPLLEEIRILSELERKEKLLQVVLVGQPELRSNLRLPEMRQVDQRVSVRCELGPLDAAGVAGYVRHRLGVAGRGASRVEFTPPALDALAKASYGVPRLINRICDRGLQRAFASQTRQVDAACVWTAVGDLGLGTPITIPDPAAKAASIATIRPAAADTPQFPAVVRAVDVTASPEPLPSLLDFNSESDARVADGHWSAPSDARYGRMALASAAVLGVSISIGVPAWYASSRGVDGRELAAMLPPPLARTLPTPASPPMDASGLRPLEGAVHDDPVSTEPAVRTDAPTPGGYAILVASFHAPDRAERLVEELATAGYTAQIVERTGGPAGRLMQVRVGGYTASADVQRDLQRIRELPGGYGDAQIVEQRRTDSRYGRGSF